MAVMGIQATFSGEDAEPENYFDSALKTWSSTNAEKQGVSDECLSWLSQRLWSYDLTALYKSIIIRPIIIIIIIIIIVIIIIIDRAIQWTPQIL